MDETKGISGGEPNAMAVRRAFGAGEAARRRAARLIAIAVDMLQIVVFPAFFPGIVSPLNNVLDVVTGIFMTVLLGWHVAFIPKSVPFVDLFPSWTLAVLFVTRKKIPVAPAADAAPR